VTAKIFTWIAAGIAVGAAAAYAVRRYKQRQV